MERPRIMQAPITIVHSQSDDDLGTITPKFKTPYIDNVKNRNSI